MIVSVHIPKTGGSSFLTFLWQNISPSLLREDWAGGPRLEGGVGFRAGVRQSFQDRRDRRELYENREAYACVHGHFRASKYASMSTKMVAWVRDPVERVASHYAQFERHPDPANALAVAVQGGLSLRDFASLRRMRNLQSRYIDLPLRRFTFIGRTEHFDADLPRAASAVGLELFEPRRVNVNPASDDPYMLSDDDRARILDLNRRDAKLYELVEKQFHA